MTHFINNLNYIGRTLFPKTGNTKLKTFNKTAMAKFLEMDLPTLSRWISGKNPISHINLIRIANKLSDYFKIEIPPEIILKGNLKNYIEQNKTDQRYITTDLEKTFISDKKSLLDEISFLLNKHREMQSIIYELLNKYDKK